MTHRAVTPNTIIAPIIIMHVSMPVELVVVALPSLATVLPQSTRAIEEVIQFKCSENRCAQLQSPISNMTRTSSR